MTSSSSPLPFSEPAPVHGGRLREAARRYGIPLADWIDLSTGINPNGFPVPDLPASVWNRLPEDDDGLEAAAARYYGALDPLPVAGSQAAIQALPRLRAPGRIGVPAVGYQEHAHAWRCAGHEVIALEEGDPTDWLARDALDCLVVIHPNNPTGRRWPLDTLLEWRERLAARGGWLIVDEAFMDVTPEQSLLAHAGLPGLVVLRSLGKFFGLAGARVGFVWAEARLRQSLRDWLGPWCLSGAARAVASAALADHDWQQQTRQQLLAQGQCLQELLTRQGLCPSGSTALFQWVRTAQAQDLYEALARHGILTRLFTEPASLRFGLPVSEAQWQRLAQTLAALVQDGCLRASADGSGA